MATNNLFYQVILLHRLQSITVSAT